MSCTFFEKRSTVIGRKPIQIIDNAVNEETVKQSIFPGVHENNGSDVEDHEELPPGDLGMNISVPYYAVAYDGSQVVPCCTATKQNLVQFDNVVSLISVSFSFPQSSKVCQAVCNRLFDAIKIYIFFDGGASNLSRITCVLGHQMIADLMARSWAFSETTYVYTDVFSSSYLDVRI